MELKLYRKEYTEISTEGELYIDDVFECYTLEDPVRDFGIKIYGETAITADRYQIIIDFSNRFQRMMPHILDVPGFEGIRIHAGNTAENTEGCILVGQDKGGPNFIGSSRKAFDILFAKLESALNGGEECWIEIIDCPNDVDCFGGGGE